VEVDVEMVKVVEVDEELGGYIIQVVLVLDHIEQAVHVDLGARRLRVVLHTCKGVDRQRMRSYSWSRRLIYRHVHESLTCRVGEVVLKTNCEEHAQRLLHALHLLLLEVKTIPVVVAHPAGRR